jgi:hypothetical protein
MPYSGKNLKLFQITSEPKDQIVVTTDAAANTIVAYFPSSIFQYLKGVKLATLTLVIGSVQNTFAGANDCTCTALKITAYLEDAGSINSQSEASDSNIGKNMFTAAGHLSQKIIKIRGNFTDLLNDFIDGVNLEEPEYESLQVSLVGLQSTANNVLLNDISAYFDIYTTGGYIESNDVGGPV